LSKRCWVRKVKPGDRGLASLSSFHLEGGMVITADGLFHCLLSRLAPVGDAAINPPNGHCWTARMSTLNPEKGWAELRITVWTLGDRVREKARPKDVQLVRRAGTRPESRGLLVATSSLGSLMSQKDKAAVGHASSASPGWCQRPGDRRLHRRSRQRHPRQLWAMSAIRCRSVVDVIFKPLLCGFGRPHRSLRQTCASYSAGALD